MNDVVMTALDRALFEVFRLALVAEACRASGPDMLFELDAWNTLRRADTYHSAMTQAALRRAARRAGCSPRA